MALAPIWASRSGGIRVEAQVLILERKLTERSVTPSALPWVTPRAQRSVQTWSAQEWGCPARLLAEEPA